MKENQFNTTSLSSPIEVNAYKKLSQFLKKNKISDDELISNIGLFLTRQNFSRTLFFNEIYKKIINTHGVIMEFGTRWGQNLVTLNNLRGIYEPYNYNRKIIAFDTFEGFPSVHKKDGDDSSIGDYSVTEKYKDFLLEILDAHNTLSPLNHIQKHELVVGDASKTVPAYLEKHPETIIAFAYFDFDIYKPTKQCLDSIKPFITKGSIIGFDELNYDKFPGETIALRESLGLDSYKIQRTNYAPLCSFIEIT